MLPSAAIRNPKPKIHNGISGDGRIKAPIPGLVRRVLVSVGHVVEAGQPVLRLEAMNMENEIVAPRVGTVSVLKA